MTHTASSPFNSWDALKVIGLLLMFLDHTGAFFFPEQTWMRALGRGAMPVFLFLAGFAASYRIKREILVCALLMSISDLWLTGTLRTQNMLFTIMACRLLFSAMEKRGKKIEHPYQWWVGSLAWVFPTMIVMQYGTMGLMFASAGYLQRRAQYYGRTVRRNFLLLAFLATSAITALWFEQSAIDVLITALVFCGLYVLLWRLEIRDIHWPSWAARPLKLMSRYSLYIYALHLIVLEWATGIPF